MVRGGANDPPRGLSSPGLAVSVFFGSLFRLQDSCSPLEAVLLRTEDRELGRSGFLDWLSAAWIPLKGSNQVSFRRPSLITTSLGIRSERCAPLRRVGDIETDRSRIRRSRWQKTEKGGQLGGSDPACCRTMSRALTVPSEQVRGGTTGR